jgi:hypothetical protein
MAYKYNDWTLYCKDVKLKNCNKLQTIYFFSKRQPKSGSPCDLVHPVIYLMDTKLNLIKEPAYPILRKQLNAK